MSYTKKEIISSIDNLCKNISFIFYYAQDLCESKEITKKHLQDYIAKTIEYEDQITFAIKQLKGPKNCINMFADPSNEEIYTKLVNEILEKFTDYRKQLIHARDTFKIRLLPFLMVPGKRGETTEPSPEDEHESFASTAYMKF